MTPVLSRPLEWLSSSRNNMKRVGEGQEIVPLSQGWWGESWESPGACENWLLLDSPEISLTQRE